MVRYEDVRIMVQAGLTSIATVLCPLSVCTSLPHVVTYSSLLTGLSARAPNGLCSSAAASPSQRRRGGPLEAAGEALEGSEGKRELEAFALFRRLLCRCATVWPS